MLQRGFPCQPSSPWRDGQDSASLRCHLLAFPGKPQLHAPLATANRMPAGTSAALQSPCSRIFCARLSAYTPRPNERIGLIADHPTGIASVNGRVIALPAAWNSMTKLRARKTTERTSGIRSKARQSRTSHTASQSPSGSFSSPASNHDSDLFKRFTPITTPVQLNRKPTALAIRTRTCRSGPV